MTTSVVSATLDMPWGIGEVEGLTEVESKEIVGVWSGGIGILVVKVGFPTVDPEGFFNDSVRLAPSRRSVNIGDLLGGLSHTVG